MSDSTNDNKDKYCRLLRNCYLEDGTLFNLKIIQDGKAYAYTRIPIIYKDEFLEHKVRRWKIIEVLGEILILKN